MRDAFDAFEYFSYLHRRWRFIAVACAVAGGLALAVSLMLPKRYTATASIVIEPPATNDPRTATAISPIYLESLKSYERFATSDTLFARAVSRFHLEHAPIESLKRRVLKVSKLRDTKILEIGATLPDPKLAQQFVQYLAEQTVSLSASTNSASDLEQISEARKELERAKAKLDSVRFARAGVSAREPVQALEAELDANADFLAKLRQESVTAEADLADLQARSKESGYLREQADSVRARVDVLKRRLFDLQNTITASARTLSQRTTHAEQVQTDLKSAEAAYEAASRRVLDMEAAAGTRGERLRILDPGVVPERPSSPNVPLNVFAAVLAAIVASLVFVTMQFVYRRAAPRRHMAA